MKFLANLLQHSHRIQRAANTEFKESERLLSLSLKKRNVDCPNPLAQVQLNRNWGPISMQRPIIKETKRRGDAKKKKKNRKGPVIFVASGQKMSVRCPINQWPPLAISNWAPLIYHRPFFSNSFHHSFQQLQPPSTTFCIDR